MKAFQQNLQKLEAADTQVLGVSMDSPFANKAFADSIGVTFPLVSDWGGDVTRQYGVYLDKYKAPRRINFLVGKDGKIIEHSDAFRLSTWIGQALGWKGVLFGWTGFMKRAVQKNARKSLMKFMEKKSE